MAKSVLKTISNFFRKFSPGPPPPPPKQEPPRRATERRRPRRQDSPRKQVETTIEDQRERAARPRRPRRAKGKTTSLPVVSTNITEPEMPWNADDFNVPPQEGMVRFHDLNLPTELMRAIHNLGFHYCTPIQAGILPHTLKGGDATGRAQTGTGKSAAFLITILTRLMRNPPPEPRKKGTPRALILAPTRELVLQIEKDGKDLARYSNQSVMAVYGGMDYSEQQHRLNREEVDVVTATPGRLLDFKRKRNINLSKVEILVIDEADRMLDMGFIPDVRRIIESTPMKGTRQTLFFSATLTPDVNRLAASWTRDPVHIDVTPPEEMTLAAIDQVVYTVTDDEKFTLLCNLIIKRNWERTMVFANRRDETQFLKDKLAAHGIQCGLLSGDVSQEQRVKRLEAFRNGRLKVLVATDVAARGLHIENVSHVVNYALPMDPQDYVHRIGRTGRAGATGTSVCFATETEAYAIPGIEAFIGRSLGAVVPEEDLLEPLPPLAEGVAVPKKRQSRPPGRRSPGGRSRPPGRQPGGRRRV